MQVLVFLRQLPRVKLYGLALLSTAAIVGLGFFAFSPKIGGKNSSDQSEKKASVRVEEVGKKDLRKVFSLFSPLLPWKEAFVRPLANGFVEEMPAQVGQLVKKDQVLFRMDSEAQRLRSELEQIDYEMKQLDFNVSMTLAKKNFISKQEAHQKHLDNRATIIRARLSQLENRGVSRAPFDGLVSEVGFKVGDYLDSSSNATLRLVDLSKMKVSFWVPQTIANQISKETETRIQLGEKLSDAKLIAISPTVDQKTGSVFVEAEISNHPPEWKAGQFAQVLLSLERAPGVITIPRAAVQTEGGKSFAWKVIRQPIPNNDPTRGLASTEELTIVSRVEINTGFSEENAIEIKSGLEEFDRVVTQGLAGLSEGSQVEISDDR